jgi:hypothetical protein
MKRDDLVKLLMEASELEEGHSAFIAKFFVEDFDWNGVEAEKVDRVQTILRAIGSQTMNHGRILNDMVGMIRESDQDEF